MSVIKCINVYVYECVVSSNAWKRKLKKEFKKHKDERENVLIKKRHTQKSFHSHDMYIWCAYHKN